MAAGFSVVISATDRVTASINKINRSLASMTAPVKRLNASLGKLSDVSGFSALTSGVGRLSSGMVGLARSATMVVTPLGVITSGLSLAGIYKLTETFAEFGSELGFAAKNIGISAESLHTLEGAARLSGTSASTAASGMLNLSQAITDAAGGRNLEALGYFRQLGINIRDSNGALRSAQAILPEVADSIGKISNPQLQRRVAAAFGMSDDMLPFLRRGAVGLREYEIEARKYGVINDAGVQSANDMRMAQSRLSLSVEGLSYAVAEKLSPVLSPWLTQMADWVAKHRTDIADTVGRIAAQFKNWADNGGTQSLIDGFLRFVDVLSATGRLIVTILEKLGMLEKTKGVSLSNLGLPQEDKDRLGIGNNGMRSGPASVGMGAISSDKMGAFRDGVAAKEHARYDQMGGSSGRFAGKYQLGGAEIAETANRLGETPPSQAEFLADPAMQERYFRAYTEGHDATLMKINPKYAASSPDDRLRALAYAHNQGAGGADRWINGGASGRDAFGTSGASYADEVSRRLGSLPGPYTPTAPAVAPAAGAAGASGTVKVEIVHSNAPAGTAMKVSSTGPVQASAKIGTSNALMGVN